MLQSIVTLAGKVASKLNISVAIVAWGFVAILVALVVWYFKRRKKS